MTISTSTRTAGPFLGNGVTTVLPFTFKVFATTDLVLTNTSAAGVDTTLVLGTHYTVTLNANQDVSPGGNVTMLTAPPTGEKTTVVSAVPDTQTNVFTVGGAWSPTVMNSALDKLTILELQGKANVSRALKIPSSDGSINTELPTAAIRANSIMAFDSAGYPILISQPSGTSINYPNVQGPTGSILVGFTQSGTGAVTRTSLSKMRDTVNAADFGAIGDGVTDDRAAIQLALDSGAKRVELNAGTFIVGNNGGGASLLIPSGVSLIGSGYGGTIVKLKAGANADVITVSSVTNVGLFNLTIDGSRATQTIGVEGFRSAGVDGLIIENVRVMETYDYGLGFEMGAQKNIFINNLFIKNTGADGLDIKNASNTNENIIISNVLIDSHGLSGVAGQTGIDVRGPASLSNITVKNVPSNGAGIRFRNGETVDIHGLGGHKSSLNGFRIYAGGKATNIGLANIARDVQVSNGYVYGFTIGVETLARGMVGANIICEECDTGFNLDQSAPEISSDTKLTNCHAIRATPAAGMRGFKIGSSGAAISAPVINSCISTGGVEGLNIGANVVDAVIVDTNLTGNTSPVSDSSTSAHYSKNKGYKTESVLLSAGLAIDSTGTKSDTIAHGLQVTPSIQSCALSLVRVSAVTDPIFGYWWVESTDATNVTVRLRVTTASATGGATCKLSLNINAKP